MSCCDTKKPAQPTPTPTQPSPVQACNTCTITSQTVATSPANRARTRIGVGEEVELTVSPGSATWTITGGTGNLNPSSGSRTTVTFTADDNAGSVTITATGSGCSCTITFTIVQPSGWTMKRQPGTILKHTIGRPDCGWLGITYFHPNDVNFYRVEDREKDSQAVASGCFSPDFTGLWHGKYPLPDRVSAWFPIVSHSSTDGSTDNAPDQIYASGPAAAGAAPPFTVGQVYVPITLQWHVVGNATVHDFSAVRQEHEIFANGRAEARKGGHTEFCMYTDPTGTPF